jgi:hypothetical protein
VRETDRDRQLPRGVVFALAWVTLFVLSALWALATPPSGAPDEPSHIVKAASVARGQFVGETTDKGQVVTVPSYIAFSQTLTCFAFDTEASPSCASAIAGDPWADVQTETTAGLYNPVYYLIVGWPTLIFHDSSGIVAMRLVSALASSLFLAAAFAMIAGWRRRALPLVALVIAVTPMVLFLNGTVNPNALEITAVLAAFVGVLSTIVDPRPDRLGRRALMVMIASAIAANTRGLSPAWLLIALLAPLLLADRSRLRSLVGDARVRVVGAVIAVTALGAVAWTVLSGSLAAAPGGGTSVWALPDATPLDGFLLTTERTFDYTANMVGLFGWVDTPAPKSVYLLWAALTGGLLLASAVVLRGRALVFVAALSVGLVVLPGVFQAGYVRSGGLIWQGRYALPLFVCLMVACGAALSQRLPAATDASRALLRRLAIVTITLWSIAQLFAFLTALRRYTVGLGGGWLEMLQNPSWAPDSGVVPLVVAFTISAAAIPTAAALLSRTGATRRRVAAIDE